jgi:hypothetical protein
MKLRTLALLALAYYAGKRIERGDLLVYAGPDKKHYNRALLSALYSPKQKGWPILAMPKSNAQDALD